MVRPAHGSDVLEVVRSSTVLDRHAVVTVEAFRDRAAPVGVVAGAAIAGLEPIRAPAAVALFRPLDDALPPGARTHDDGTRPGRLPLSPIGATPGAAFRVDVPAVPGADSLHGHGCIALI